MYNDDILLIDRRTGRNIYGMRVQTNCTQEEFGKKVGITQSAMSAIELGKALPSEKLVLRIADWFGIDPMQITGQKPMSWSSL